MDENTKETSNKIKLSQSTIEKMKRCDSNEWKHSRKVTSIVTNVIDSHNKDIARSEEFLVKTEEDKFEFFAKLMYLVTKSGGDVDKYGTPTEFNQSKFNLDRLLTDVNVRENLKKEMRYYFSIIEDLDEERNDEIIDYAIDKMPFIIESMKKSLGNQFQKYIREMHKMSDSSIVRDENRGRPRGQSKEIKDRNSNIRTSVSRMVKKGMKYKDAYAIVSEDFNLSAETIKSICDYKY